MTGLGFIGAGNMGGAIIKGVPKGFAGIYAYDPFPKQGLDCEFLSSESEVAEKCDYILLAVKPQSVKDALVKIAPAITPEKVIISICAGISCEFIRANTISGAKVVRVMPNAPMMLGLGASAVSFTDNVTDGERAFALDLLNSLGITEVIPEDKMNEVVCINGSSPAFIYYFAKCFIDYASCNGLDGETALRLFAQSLIGAGNMLINSGMSVEALIEQVSSKGGTTIAGLAKLREHGLEEAVKAACSACTDRARQLGQS